jgi:hypothetical protein
MMIIYSLTYSVTRYRNAFAAEFYIREQNPKAPEGVYSLANSMNHSQNIVTGKNA